MSRKVRWGVLSTARIARVKVIPAMQQGNSSEVVAIASRDGEKARAVADELGILRAYGSYEELIADPEVDAVYNPLPNHLHVPWSSRAAEAGKHVLCEKPIGLHVGDCRKLMDARDRTGVKIGEAFMVRTHPQWLRARELVRAGDIGELTAIAGVFSYYNRDPKNIRSVPEWGGGALLDIGCYPIQISRFLFGKEPLRVAGAMQQDPNFGIDRLTSGLLEFSGGHCVFTCSMQMAYYQRVQILGTKGRIEVEVPFNAPADRPTRLVIDSCSDLFGGGIRVEEIGVCDQYTIQGDLFSEAILTGGEVPTPLEDSLGNMTVIDALFESARSSQTIQLT